MIEFDHLSKRFGSLPVLRDVSLVAARGRVLGVVGPNGAGKTTLIKMLLGLTFPDGGVIRVGGEAIGRTDAYRARIGYMPQIARFPENVTGAELYAMMRELRGAAATDEDLVDRLDLRRELDKPLRVLSGGTRQKVNAGLAFLFAPEILVLDEPTAGLDPRSSASLKDKIIATRDAGATVIVTSHIMAELEELCDDVAFLLDGRVHYVGPVSELTRVTRQTNLERAIAALMIRGVA